MALRVWSEERTHFFCTFFAFTFNFHTKALSPWGWKFEAGEKKLENVWAGKKRKKRHQAQRGKVLNNFNFLINTLSSWISVAQPPPSTLSFNLPQYFVNKLKAFCSLLFTFQHCLSHDAHILWIIWTLSSTRRPFVVDCNDMLTFEMILWYCWK